MDTKRILKGVGIGCGAFVVWIIGVCIAVIVAFLLLEWIAHDHEEQKEIIVAKEGDNLEMVAIGNTYLRQIESLRRSYNDVKVGYVFYDVTNDGIPELWACTSDFFIGEEWHANRLQIYTYTKGEGIMQLYQSGDIGVPSGFYTDGNALVREELGGEDSGFVRSWVKYSYDKKTKKIDTTIIPLDQYEPDGQYLPEIWSGTKTLKKMLGLKYDEDEEENDTNIL